MKPEKSDEMKKTEKLQRLKRQVEALECVPARDLTTRQTTLKVAIGAAKK